MLIFRLFNLNRWLQAQATVVSRVNFWQAVFEIVNLTPESSDDLSLIGNKQSYRYNAFILKFTSNCI